MLSNGEPGSASDSATQTAIGSASLRGFASPEQDLRSERAAAECRAATQRITRRAKIESIQDWAQLGIALTCASAAIVCGALRLLAPELIHLTELQAYYALGGGLGFFGIKPFWLVAKRWPAP
jgi:hypothetical protein